MASHVGAASAEMPTGSAQVRGTAVDPKNIGVGVASQRVARALGCHHPEHARLIEGAGAARDVGPQLEVAKTFAAPVGTARDVGCSDHAWRLADVDAFIPVVLRYRFRCHIVRRRGCPVLHQAAIARTASGQDEKSESKGHTTHADKPKANSFVPPHRSGTGAAHGGGSYRNV